MAVQPSQPGKRPCNNCDKNFLSPDRMRIRTCPKCKKAEEQYSPRALRPVTVSNHLRKQLPKDSS